MGAACVRLRALLRQLRAPLRSLAPLPRCGRGRHRRGAIRRRVRSRLRVDPEPGQGRGTLQGQTPPGVRRTASAGGDRGRAGDGGAVDRPHRHGALARAGPLRVSRSVADRRGVAGGGERRRADVELAALSRRIGRSPPTRAQRAPRRVGRRHLSEARRAAEASLALRRARSSRRLRGRRRPARSGSSWPPSAATR